MALNDTEYLYASSNIRANEGAVSYRERLNKLLECKSIDELYELVVTSEESVSYTKKEQIESALDKKVDCAFDLVGHVVPDKSIYNFLKYEYDCCNLKLALKCLIKGIECTSDMVYACGSVDIIPLLNDIKEGNFSAFPKNMACAAIKAREVYAKTQNPRDIDIIIDKACFCDMLENVSAGGCEMFVRLVKMRIDKANVVTFVRVASSEAADKTRLMAEAVIDGGYIPFGLYEKNIDIYDGSLSLILSGTKYSDIALSLGGEFTFGQLEKMFDDVILSCIKGTEFVPFGAQVPFAYLVKTIYEIKNIRIILAGICSKLPQEKIRERVRFGYV